MFSLLLGIEDPPFIFVMMEAIFVIILGLCLGSFSTAITYRVPRGLSWVKAEERSRCTSCNTTLTSRDLVPLFSWLLNRGKCRHCGHKISAIYPLTEIATALLCLLIFLVYDTTILQKYTFIAAVPFLMSLLVIDIQRRILPNQLMIIFACLGTLNLCLKIYETHMVEALLFSHLGGAFLWGGISLAMASLMRLSLKKEALGMGDIKFFAVAGLWLGAGAIGPYFILSGLLGVFFGVLWKIKTKQAAFPFGPALIVSFYLMNLAPSFFTLKTIQYF